MKKLTNHGFSLVEVLTISVIGIFIATAVNFALKHSLSLTNTIDTKININLLADMVNARLNSESSTAGVSQCSQSIGNVAYDDAAASSNNAATGMPISFALNIDGIGTLQAGTSLPEFKIQINQLSIINRVAVPHMADNYVADIAMVPEPLRDTGSTKALRAVTLAKISYSVSGGNINDCEPLSNYPHLICGTKSPTMLYAPNNGAADTDGCVPYSTLAQPPTIVPVPTPLPIPIPIPTPTPIPIPTPVAPPPPKSDKNVKNHILEFNEVLSLKEHQ